MSSSTLHRRTAIAGLLGLAGCGFVPVYGQNDLRGRFSFAADDTIIGFQLRDRLAQRLGQPDSPQFAINVTIATSERAAAITAEGDTARLNVIGRADWTMIALADDSQIDGGTAEAFTSYAATGSTVATLTTRDDALERLAIILADMIVARVLARAAELGT